MLFPELNPHHWSIYASVLVSLLVFYLVGQFFLERSRTPVKSIGLRMAVGLLFSISVIATVFTVGQTGLLFVLILILALGINRRFQIDFSDLKDFGFSKLIVVSLLIIVGVTIDGERADLVQGEEIYVGNSDVGHYASYGYSLFQHGIETNAEKITPERKPTLYHFGDLWLNGVYSYGFNVLPYYSHLLVTRWLLMVIIGFCVYGWLRSMNMSRKKSVLGVWLFFFAVYLEFFEIPSAGISLFEFFTFYFPPYCDASQLIVAAGFFPFWHLMTKGKEFFGLTGIWFLPFMNAAIITIPPVAGLFYAVYSTHRAATDNKLSVRTISRITALFLMAMVPITYYTVTGRMLSSGGVELNWNQLYLTAHTFIRFLLSEVFALPYLIGLLYFAFKQGLEYKRTFFSSLFLLIGAAISISVIYPMVQGNSAKVLLVHFGGILAPVGIIGLIGLSENNRRLWTIVSITLIFVTSVQVARLMKMTNFYQLTFDWSVYLDDYKEKSSLNTSDYQLMRKMLPRQKVGYFMYNQQGRYDRVNYSSFTYLKALYPGTIFYRLNATANDTVFISDEQLKYFKLSALGYFSFLNDFDSTQTTRAMVNYIQPDVIIQPTDSNYTFPSTLSNEYKNATTLKEYVIYSK